MTTPERFRRRQRIEGTILLVLGIFTIFLAVYFNTEDKRQRECIATKFTALTDSLEVRGELADAEARNQTRVILGVSHAETPIEFRRILDDFIVEQNRIDRIRKNNPVPPFPEGACDQ